MLLLLLFAVIALVIIVMNFKLTDNFRVKISDSDLIVKIYLHVREKL